MSSSLTTLFFGPHIIQRSSLFYESSLSYGLVNLKPILPGHVLIIPKRVVPRFSDLSESEVIDLYKQVWKIQPILEKHYQCSGSNIAMQDGKSAGQSVPHVHVHILPRKKKDVQRNDEVYEELEQQKLGEAIEKIEKRKDDDAFAEENRKIRSQEEMSKEASELKMLFDKEYWPKEVGNGTTVDSESVGKGAEL